VIRNFLFWFCVPWALFLGLAGVMYFFRHPEKLLWLLPIIILLGFATRAEYVKLMAKADVRPAEAGRPKQEATGQDAQRFNPRGPGQFTSFAFRYGLPPDVLKRKGSAALPPPPPALPPPAADE
jgi:hypothetical protein